MSNVFDRGIRSVTFRFEDNDEITFTFDGCKVTIDCLPEDFEAARMLVATGRITAGLASQLIDADTFTEEEES